MPVVAPVTANEDGTQQWTYESRKTFLDSQQLATPLKEAQQAEKTPSKGVNQKTPSRTEDQQMAMNEAEGLSAAMDPSNARDPNHVPFDPATHELKSPSNTLDQKTPTRTQDQKTPSRTEDQKTPSRTQDQKTPSRTQDQKTPSRTQDQKTPSRTQDQDLKSADIDPSGKCTPDAKSKPSPSKTTPNAKSVGKRRRLFNSPDKDEKQTSQPSKALFHNNNLG